MDPPEVTGDLDAVAFSDLTRGDEVEDALVTGELAGGSLDRLTLAGCRLDGVRLTGSSFEGLVLEDVLLVGCELSGVTLGTTKLRRVRFENCRMSGLSTADLHAEHVSFVDDRLDDAWFRMAEI
ncbi:MAG: pentapeptide repeat-containing protein, partial [Acidimicrobiales bacterium]